jgi:hypothetical protein
MVALRISVDGIRRSGFGLAIRGSGDSKDSRIRDE